MPKRKTVTKEATPESDLSSPPEDLLETELPAPSASTAANGRANKRRRVVKKEVIAVKQEVTATPSPAKNATRQPRVKVETAVEARSIAGEISPPPRRRKAKKEEDLDSGEEEKKKPVKRTKTKAQKEAEAMPLAARTIGHKLFIGAHVSSAGGQSLFVLPSNRTSKQMNTLPLCSPTKSPS